MVARSILEMWSWAHERKWDGNLNDGGGREEGTQGPSPRPSLKLSWLSPWNCALQGSWPQTSLLHCLLACPHPHSQVLHCIVLLGLTGIRTGGGPILASVCPELLGWSLTKGPALLCRPFFCPSPLSPYQTPPTCPLRFYAGTDSLSLRFST